MSALTSRKVIPARERPDWTIMEEITVNGRRVTPGTELSIAGVRGRVTFVRHVTTEAGSEWIDVRSGDWLRAFRVERVRTVHLRPRRRHR